MKKGISASKGYAIGNVVLQESHKIIITEKKISDANSEKARLQSAINKSREQLILIKNKAESEMGADKAEVFESHIMLLDDPEFIGSVEKDIESNLINAEKALDNTTKSFLAFEKFSAANLVAASHELRANLSSLRIKGLLSRFLLSA